MALSELYGFSNTESAYNVTALTTWTSDRQTDDTKSC